MDMKIIYRATAVTEGEAGARNRASRDACGNGAPRTHVADRLCGSMPMITRAMLLFLLDRTDRCRRGGQRYFELGIPLWSLSAPRRPAGRMPDESHTKLRWAATIRAIRPVTSTKPGRAAVVGPVNE